VRVRADCMRFFRWSGLILVRRVQSVRVPFSVVV
jgi:hypothetical protein